MLDPSEKGSEPEDMSIKFPEGENQQKKACANCGTSKTPLWRAGPAGPKSLCNACGIRSRKKKRDSLGLKKGATNEKKTRKGINHNGSRNGGNSNNNNNGLGDGLKQRLMALGREGLMQISMVEEKQTRKLGEEEQAAVLLMALSYGSVYA